LLDTPANAGNVASKTANAAARHVRIESSPCSSHHRKNCRIHKGQAMAAKEGEVLPGETMRFSKETVDKFDCGNHQGATMELHQGAVAFKGTPLALRGRRPTAGSAAPEFSCVTQGLEVINLAKTPAKARLFSVVPSLDTPVCSAQTKKFDE